MARPIPDLDQMEANEVAIDDDLLIDDVSAGETKRIQVGKLLGLPKVGWTAAGESWSYSSWSASTRIGIITVPSDATTKYTPGMRVQISQSTGGTKYGIIHGVSSTTLTVFFPSGTTLNDEAISTPFYSVHKAPFGFDCDPSVWTLMTQNGTSRSTSSTSWTSLVDSLVVGIGIWNIGYTVTDAHIGIGTSTGRVGRITLSTTTNSETHADLTSTNVQSIASSGDTALSISVSKIISLAAQATFRILAMVDNPAHNITLCSRGGMKTIRAVSAYL